MNETRSENVTRVATDGIVRRTLRHLYELSRLAGPIVVSRSGFLLLVMMDTIMTGRYATQELAFLAISLSIFMPMMIVTLGMVMGTLVLTANKHGAGLLAECGPIWRRSVQFALLLGAVSFVIGLFGEKLLLWSGQTHAIAVGGGEVVFALGLGLCGHLVFLSSAFFLEGLGRPRPAMFVMIGANALNFGLNWVLIYGALGNEPMGAAGAAYATTLTRWTMAIALGLIVWNLRDQEALRIREPLEGGFSSWRALRRIGYAIGLSVGVESIAFAALNAFAGWLGAVPLAAYGMTFNLMAFIFMLAIGVGAATAVRVGNAYGRGDMPDAALAGWVGVAATLLIMFVAGLSFSTWPEPLAGIYTDDPILLAQAIIAIAFIKWTSMPDGGQATMANALRGRGDVWIPCLIQTICFFFVMVPIAYVCAFTWGYGISGLFYGIIAGCVASLVALSVRFQLLIYSDMKKV